MSDYFGLDLRPVWFVLFFLSLSLTAVLTFVTVLLIRLLGFRSAAQMTGNRAAPAAPPLEVDVSALATWGDEAPMATVAETAASLPAESVADTAATTDAPVVETEEIPPAASAGTEVNATAQESVTDTEENGDMEALDEHLRIHCLQCKTHRPVIKAQYRTTPTGRRQIVGECPVCGSRLSKFAKTKS